MFFLRLYPLHQHYSSLVSGKILLRILRSVFRSPILKFDSFDHLFRSRRVSSFELVSLACCCSRVYFGILDRKEDFDFSNGGCCLSSDLAHDLESRFGFGSRVNWCFFNFTI